MNVVMALPELIEELRAQVVELQTKNDRLHRVLDAIPDHITLRANDGTVVYRNRAARRSLMGDLEPELDGTHVAEALVPDVDGPRWREELIGPVSCEKGNVGTIAVRPTLLPAPHPADGAW